MDIHANRLAPARRHSWSMGTAAACVAMVMALSFAQPADAETTYITFGSSVGGGGQVSYGYNGPPQVPYYREAGPFPETFPIGEPYTFTVTDGEGGEGGFMQRNDPNADGISPNAPDNGTVEMSVGNLNIDTTVTLTHDDAATFSLGSIDLAEYSTFFPDAPVTVDIVGTLVGGSTVNTSFTTDGYIDGAGGQADFEQFFFGSEWMNLQSVAFSSSSLWAMDNIVLIPEPGTGPLLAIGLLAIGWRQSRRTARTES